MINDKIRICDGPIVKIEFYVWEIPKCYFKRHLIICLVYVQSESLYFYSLVDVIMQQILASSVQI